MHRLGGAARRLGACALLGSAAQPPSAQPPSAQPPVSKQPPATQPPATPPAATQPAATLEVTPTVYSGWKTFAVNCTRCHGEDAIGSTIAPSLVKSLQQSVTHEVFVQTVTQGRPTKGMPTWGGMLDSTQIEQVYAYLKSRSDGRLAPGRPHVAKPGGR